MGALLRLLAEIIRCEMTGVLVCLYRTTWGGGGTILWMIATSMSNHRSETLDCFDSSVTTNKLWSPMVSSSAGFRPSTVWYIMVRLFSFQVDRLLFNLWVLCKRDR